VKGTFELNDVNSEVRPYLPTSQWDWKFTKYY